MIEDKIGAGQGDAPAFITESRIWSYSETACLIEKVSDGLAAEGIRKGDRVILALPDSIEFVASFFAVIQIGAVAVPINIYQSRDDYDHILRRILPKLVLTHHFSAQFNAALRLNTATSDFRTIFVSDPTSVWHQWIRERPTAKKIVAPSENDIAFLLWTSGTTGMSIPVPHRQSDCEVCCRNYASSILAVTPHDVFLSTSRMFHAYGLGNSVLFPLFAGARSVLIPEKPTPKATFRIAQEMNATILFSVPTFYSMMIELADRGEAPVLPHLRLSVSAAEPLASKAVARWKALFGVEILDGFGSTEALHIYLSARSGEIIPGSVGKPVPGYQIQLRTDSGVASVGEVGTLWLQGGSIAQSYWNEPAATMRSMVDGWFITGDKFYQDDLGYFYFMGRADSMFRISGKWVSAIEIEAVMGEHPSVKEISVVGYLDDDGFSRLCAFVVTYENRHDTDALETQLRGLAEQKLPLWKRPTEFKFIEALPRTATGKVQRFLLKSITFQ